MKLRALTVTATVGLVLFMTAGTASASPGSPDPFWYSWTTDEGFRYWFGTAWFTVAEFLQRFGIDLSY